jgi:predicted O-methyltransferase YrrM
MNWFNRVRGEFKNAMRHLPDGPVVYVEIGTWTGDSAEWVLKHLIDARPDSVGYGIDSYQKDWKRGQDEIDQIKAAAVARLKPWEDSGKWRWLFAKSQDALREWSGPQIDLLYIDGSHYAHDVVLDFAYAWPHLKKGSLVCFDDFGIGQRQTKADGIPRVQQAVEAIMSTWKMFLEPVPTYGHRQFAATVKLKPVWGELVLARRPRGETYTIREDLL